MANSSGELPALMTCPACKAAEGVVYRAGSVQDKPDVIRVDARCPACGHAWQVERRSGDPLKARSL